MVQPGTRRLHGGCDLGGGLAQPGRRGARRRRARLLPRLLRRVSRLISRLISRLEVV